MKRKLFLDQKTLPILLLILSAVWVIVFFLAAQGVAGESPDISNFTARSSDDAITLSWENPAFRWGCRTDLTITSGSKQEVVSLSQLASSYTFSGGTHGQRYSFSVQRLNGDDPAGEVQTASAMYLDFQQLPDLPLVSIQTQNGKLPSYTQAVKPEGYAGNSITNNDYVHCQMTIAQQGITSSNCSAEIRIRGNTSALVFDKKPYKIKLSQPADLFYRNNPLYADREYALLPCFFDLRLEAGMLVAEQCGMEWQPLYKPVNLIINGDWQGCYYLIESVNTSAGRLNLSDTGFLIENDAYFWNSDGAYFRTPYQPDLYGYTFQYPEITAADLPGTTAISDFVAEYERALIESAGDFTDYIDLDSFSGWLLAHDILGTLDAAGSNMFLYKYDLDPANPFSSKLKMGPIWDLDSSFSREGIWASVHIQNVLHFNELLQKPAFLQAYKGKWAALSPTLTSTICARLDDYIARCGDALQQSWELEAARWSSSAGSLDAVHSGVKQWFETRTLWLNEAINNM